MAFDHRSILSKTTHRPWAAPEAPWRWRQSWLDLAFFHWRVPKELIEIQLPDGLEIDLFDGEAWVSIVPFRMEGVMLRGVPDIPGLSAFPELNVRTYVISDGKPGVWFFSLDATNALAVASARALFHLPYFRARMSCEDREGSILYDSRRCCDQARFEAVYTPCSGIEYSLDGSLEAWLSERYCLYACCGRHLYRAEVHHERWPLQQVKYEISVNEVAERAGLILNRPPALAQFSKRLDVVVWGLEKC